jgi:hypothetical protein
MQQYTGKNYTKSEQHKSEPNFSVKKWMHIF